MSTTCLSILCGLLLALGAAPLAAAQPHVAVIVEATTGTVRLLPGGATTITTEVLKGDRRALKAGDRLIIPTGSAVSLFDGRNRRIVAQTAGKTTPLTYTVPPSPAGGVAVARLLSSASQPKPVTVKGGVIVRDPLRPVVDITYPPRAGGFTGATLPPAVVYFSRVDQSTAELELVKVDSVEDRDGEVLRTVSIPTSAGTHEVPLGEASPDAPYLLYRLKLDGEAWDERQVWQESVELSRRAAELVSELGLESTEELKRMPAWEYLLQQAESDRLPGS